MISVDLVTGFLGAGKTTFIHKYLHYLKSRGLRVRVIENEYGDVSMDADLLADECEVEDLTGMCMCCVGKSAFIRMLKETAASGCDRIIVEPSGVYDVDEFFEVLSLPGVKEYCEISSIITVADVNGIASLSDEATYLLFSQLVASGVVVVSKLDTLKAEAVGIPEADCSAAMAENCIRELNDLMRAHGSESGLLCEVITKSFDDFTDWDFEDIMDAGYMRVVHDREYFRHEEVFGAESYIVRGKDPETLERNIKAIFASSECGTIFRVKGYAEDADGKTIMVSCTPDTMQVGYTKTVKPESTTAEAKRQSRTEVDPMITAIGQNIRRRVIRELLTS